MLRFLSIVRDKKFFTFFRTRLIQKRNDKMYHAENPLWCVESSHSTIRAIRESPLRLNISPFLYTSLDHNGAIARIHDAMHHFMKAMPSIHVRRTFHAKG